MSQAGLEGGGRRGVAAVFAATSSPGQAAFMVLQLLNRLSLQTLQ